jgi:hypothetical protein
MGAFAEGVTALLNVVQRLAIWAVVALVLFAPGLFPLLDRFIFETTSVNFMGATLKISDTRQVRGLELRDGKLFLNGDDVNNLSEQRDQARSEAATLREQARQLAARLTEASAALARAARPDTAPSPELSAEAMRLAEVAAAAQRTQQTAQAAAPQVSPSQAPVFGVVFGADRTIPAAMDEVRRARDATPAPVSLYERQGTWRGIAGFETREAARAALPRYTAFRPDAYVVDLRGWCPNASAQPRHPQAPDTPLWSCGF